jgi:hypothetical protein
MKNQMKLPTDVINVIFSYDARTYEPSAETKRRYRSMVLRLDEVMREGIKLSMEETAVLVWDDDEDPDEWNPTVVELRHDFLAPLNDSTEVSKCLLEAVKWEGWLVG